MAFRSSTTFRNSKSQRSVLDRPDLLKTADVLLSANIKKPRQSDLRRAVSTIYYAMFHELAKSCSDHLIGGDNSDRSDPAWQQVYRSLHHGIVKSQCLNEQKTLSLFPPEIGAFGRHFVAMQKKRNSADYDPFYRIEKSQVENDWKITEEIIDGYRSCKSKSKRAFAAFCLLKTPKH